METQKTKTPTKCNGKIEGGGKCKQIASCGRFDASDINAKSTIFTAVIRGECSFKIDK